MEFAPPFEYHIVMAQAGTGQASSEDTSLTSLHSSTSTETPTDTSGVSSFNGNGEATTSPENPDLSNSSSTEPTDTPTSTSTAGGGITVPVLTPIKPDAPSSSTTYPDIKKEDEQKQATTTVGGTFGPTGGSSNNLGDHVLNTFTGNPYEFDRFSVGTTRILLTIASVLAIVGLLFIRGGVGLRSARVTPLFQIKEKSYGNQ